MRELHREGAVRRFSPSHRAVPPVLVGAFLGAALLAGCGTSAEPPAALPALRPAQAVAFVEQSTRQTIQQRTADVSVQGSVEIGGVQTPVTGSGVEDFVNGHATMTLAETISGKPVAVTELGVGGKLYMGMTVDGQDLASIVGKQWILIPIGIRQGEGSVTANPVAQLRALEGKGIGVKSLTSKSINGMPCRGFSVKPSRATLLRLARLSEYFHNLSRGQRAELAATLTKSNPPRITVWFDASGLVRQMTVQLPVGPTMTSGSLSLDFTHYGVPDTIAVPASSDVISLAHFESAIKSLSGGGSVLGQ